MIFFFSVDNIKFGMIVIVGNVFLDMYFEIEKVMFDGILVICYYKFLGDYMKKFISVVVMGVYGKMLIMGLLVYVI